MQRTPVDSTNLASVGYDADTKMLEVEFHGGSAYQYEGKLYRWLRHRSS